MRKGLPRGGPLIARGLLVALVEPVEDGEHDQQAKGQGPCQLTAEARGDPMHLEPQLIKDQPNAKRDQDRRGDQRDDAQVEQQRRACKPFAKRQPRQNRDRHARHHHHQSEREGPTDTATDITHGLFFEQVAEPVQRDAVHRKGEATLRPLETPDAYGLDRAVEKQHEQPEKSGQQVKTSAASFHAHNSFRISTSRSSTAITISTVQSSTTAVAAAEGYCNRLISFEMRRPTLARCEPDINRTVIKSPITSVVTKIVPIMMPGLHSGTITFHRV